jgi:hypothetical protein
MPDYRCNNCMRLLISPYGNPSRCWYCGSTNVVMAEGGGSFTAADSDISPEVTPEETQAITFDRTPSEEEAGSKEA